MGSLNGRIRASGLARAFSSNTLIYFVFLDPFGFVDDSFFVVDVISPSVAVDPFVTTVNPCLHGFFSLHDAVIMDCVMG